MFGFSFYPSPCAVQVEQAQMDFFFTLRNGDT